MAETLSNMIPLGTKAPDFNLIDVTTNQNVSLQTIRSPIATVVMFICNHCPFVKHIQSELVNVANKYHKKNINFVAISANDVIAYPSDSVEKMREEAKKHHYPFPYLYDETQDIARAYHAACTPDFYIFDKNLLCVYRGRFDDATPGNRIPVTGKELTGALDAILANKAVDENQHASIGCNIKWKK